MRERKGRQLVLPHLLHGQVGAVQQGSQRLCETGCGNSAAQVSD